MFVNMLNVMNIFVFCIYFVIDFVIRLIHSRANSEDLYKRDW
ncbi:MAG: hypothetical protein ACI90V_014510, partial [Bacillariaceae sp.]